MPNQSWNVVNRLIIDGYNVIYAFPDLRQSLSVSLESARNDLYALVCKWALSHPTWDVVVVYDGQRVGRGSIQKNRSGSAGVRYIFTASTVEADDAIKKAVRENKSSQQTVVISRDREILGCCRDHGVRSEPPEYLIKRAETIGKQPEHKDCAQGRDKKEITDWYRDELKKKGVI